MMARIKDVNLAYDDMGNGPAVVFLHGYGMNREMWKKQGRLLSAAGFRVILPDLRGFGDSSSAGAPVGIDDYADDVIALLNYLGVGRAVMCGTSLGGYVLMSILDHHRHRVAAACFIATGLDPQCTSEGEGFAECGPSDDAHRAMVNEILLNRLLGSTAPAPWHEQVRSWVESAAMDSLATAQQAMAGRRNYSSRVSEFKLPCLVIAGDRDPLVPVEESRRFVAALPGGLGCIVPGAGHLVNLEHSDQVNGCLLTFLKRLSLARPPVAPLKQVA